MELNIKENNLKHLSCLRCNSELNITSPTPKEITFYQCPQCDSHYTLHEDKSLTDRWGMPISLVLYGVIFVKRPVNSARSIAEKFALRDDIDLAFLIKNIQNELQEPTQKVSKMLNFVYPDETAMREFLKVFNAELIGLVK
jgi:hypothetical protein